MAPKKDKYGPHIESRSDFIGGIDNEALDFGNIDQYIQVSAAVGHLGDSTDSNNILNNCNTNNNNNENIIVCDPKPETPTTPPSTLNDTNLPISTLSARVSLSSTPITLTNALVNHNISHLPESPPDSGSEPPYSPLQDVHGLTLTSRELYNGSTSIHQPTTLHEMQMQTPFAPPHQHNQHSFTHSLQQHHLNSSVAPSAPPLDIANGVRVKHEAGLIINPNSLMHIPCNNNNNNQLICPNTNTNNIIHYDTMSNNNFYQNIGNIAASIEPQIPTTCMLTTTSTDSMGEVARVQLIGTSQATHTPRSSAPSTPVHLSSSRKRKMSTQIDCPDYANIKPDPGLAISPIGSSHLPLASDTQKIGPTSPVSIHLPVHNGNDVINTPAHSSASLSPALSTINSNAENSLDSNIGNKNASSANGENGDAGALTPCIRFSPFQPQNWHQLCDQSLQDISVVYYRVDADKGFNFSVSDDAFVCQKKNHFQITCHARLQGEAKFVKTPSGLEKIKSFHLHFYGVKLEAPNQTIRVEQSQSDRSKKPFYPVPIDLQSHIVSKITVGRLHFSETTNNNMRKKGRPNPEQRYFQLIVGLHVHTASGNFPVISQGSERIIVRASNPGQFESDVDLCWQRGLTQDSIFHAGRVGINTDRPDESLVVHGNLKVSGHIVQPSDSRAKQEIGELDTSVQLRNLQKIRIVRYRYEPEFAIHSGLKRASESDTEEIVDTGVIAQEVREVIPDAVQEAGSIVLPNGNVIENFLLVNKDRILMENIGAVKELCKVTGSLETRIEYLERMNNRLIRAKEIDRNTVPIHKAGKKHLSDSYEICSNRVLQIIIFFLVIVMAACLAAVSTLYFMEHNKQHHNKKQLERIQVFDNEYSYGHNLTLLNDQDQNWIHLHNLLKSNKTYPHWTNFLFGLSTTTRPPNENNDTKPLRQDLLHNDSGEIYSTAHGRNDELAAPQRGRLEGTKDFTHGETYIKYHEDGKDQPFAV
ncbi:myelin regulatory factor-like [Teleopsis dalmanni]|uniref:myelin regulatory factor-like n=1 Tax=Teleopsis dalmanni TaxID=139649 RepID=UPI0018CEDBD7|nr:myelin regulatory factor-like [Teleopsis dalmanni]